MIAPALADGVRWVGVTGHRRLDGADEDALRRTIHGLLVALIGAGPSGAISPLAEGADRMFAEEALALGLPLRAPLPFAVETYRCDFGTDASRARFDALLAAAAPEPPGAVPPGPRAEAYRAVGRRVVEASSALVAVWDGAPARGAGGTGEVVDYARERGVPTVWIEAAAPHRAHPLLPGAAWREVELAAFLAAAHG